MTVYVPAHGGADLERRRLELLDAYHGPLTLELLDAAGVGPGWRCLAVGAGSGAMTRRLAARVAPGGRAVAVDRETEWLEPLAGEDIARVDERAVAAGVAPIALQAAIAAPDDGDRLMAGPTRWPVRCRRPR